MGSHCNESQARGFREEKKKWKPWNIQLDTSIVPINLSRRKMQKVGGGSTRVTNRGIKRFYPYKKQKNEQEKHRGPFYSCLGVLRKKKKIAGPTRIKARTSDGLQSSGACVLPSRLCFFVEPCPVSAYVSSHGDFRWLRLDLGIW